jgi:hypothetical protein
LNKLFRVKPAIKKYIDVRRKAKKVDWLAKIVLCKANRSLKIRSLFRDFSIIYSFFLDVEIPKGTYKGQKLMKLVMKKMIAKINKIIAVVPLIVSL